MSDARSLDLVLFGATGFTGGLIAEYLRTRIGASLRWALAGRDRAKLESVRARLGELGEHVELITADSNDPESLRAMARRTKVVITTVGPYSRYGEPLVVACIEAGADYVDLTGETHWWREMVERHHERAVANEVLIIPACGYDCIPADMGALFCAAQLPRDQPMTIDAYARARGSFSGGTAASAMEIIGAGAFSAGKPKPDDPPLVHYARDVERWAVRSMVLDPSVVRRSAELRPRDFGDQLRYRQYFAFSSRAAAYAVVGAGAAFLAAAKLGPVRRLVTKLRPSGSGPSAEQREKGWFRFDFVARGGGREVRAHVSGGDPGYDATCKMISEAAIMLVEARAELPSSGGVVTTAAGLGLGFIPRLEAAGLEFAIDR
jgi:short subunit dehydrogenase-like uncharacterized protein